MCIDRWEDARFAQRVTWSALFHGLKGTKRKRGQSTCSLQRFSFTARRRIAFFLSLCVRLYKHKPWPMSRKISRESLGEWTTLNDIPRVSISLSQLYLLLPNVKQWQFKHYTFYFKIVLNFVNFAVHIRKKNSPPLYNTRRDTFVPGIKFSWLITRPLYIYIYIIYIPRFHKYFHPCKCEPSCVPALY